MLRKSIEDLRQSGCQQACVSRSRGGAAEKAAIPAKKL